MKNSLREIMQNIAGTAEHVASASEELSSSATLQARVRRRKPIRLPR